MGSAGMSVAFLNQTTMVFGDKEAVKAALDARDGLHPELPAEQRHDERDGLGGLEGGVEPAGPKGTQTMMKSVLGEASQLADYDTVKTRMKMRVHDGLCQWREVQMMAVVMSDTMTAATAATLMKGVDADEEDSWIAAGEVRNG